MLTRRRFATMLAQLPLVAAVAPVAPCTRPNPTAFDPLTLDQHLFFYIGMRHPEIETSVHAFTLFCKDRNELIAPLHPEDRHGFSRKESMRLARWIAQKAGRKLSRNKMHALAAEIERKSRRIAEAA